MKLNFRKKKKDVDKKKRAIIPLRLNILFFVIFVLFSVLILRLGIVQIVQGDTYKRQLEETDNVSISKNVPRGVIYDRNYNLLVGNSAVKSITYTKSTQTKSTEMFKVANKLNKLIHVKKEKVPKRDLIDYWILKHPTESLNRLTAKEKQTTDGKKTYEYQVAHVTDADLKGLSQDDLKAATIFKRMNTGYAMSEAIIKNSDVTDEEVARVSENLTDLPGVDTTTDWNRYYTYKNTLRSILGSVSSEKEGLPKDKVDYYLAQGYSRNDRVGKSYLEAQYQSILAGQKSKSDSVLDSQGNIIETVQKYEGSKGKDLVLSVDVDFQKAVEDILKKNISKGKQAGQSDLFDRAFVVAMDPYSGEVLALAGEKLNDKGGFDDYSLGTFTTAYAMGSAVKGATVLSGIMDKAITRNTVFDDHPIQFKGTKPKSSWFTTGGAFSPQRALEKSSNSYMYQVSMKMAGYNYVYDTPFSASPSTFNKMRYYYNQFGLGVKTGIDLPGEQVGFKGDDKTVGKILDFAIGQYDSYTPLQMAQYVSTIANNGNRIAPRMLKEIRNPSTSGDKVGTLATSVAPKVMNRINVTQSDIDTVKEGFHLVTHGPEGTGKAYLGDAKYDIAGKTGTAQAFYDGPKKESRGASVWNTTFVGYAPANKPEIAVSVVVPWGYRENGTDPKVNMSISREVFDKYFELKTKRAKAKKDKSVVDQPINNRKAASKAQSEQTKKDR